MDCIGMERKSWIVMAHFRSTECMNDNSYPSEDKSRVVRLGSQPREKYIFFGQISSPESASQLMDYQINSNKALWNIDIGEELNIAYGSQY